MTRWPLPTVLLGAILTLVLASCSAHDKGPNVNETLTVEQAKMIAQKMELELATYIPAGVAATVDQRPSGVLLRCSADGAYQWTGATKVRVAAGMRVDAEAIVFEIVAAYDGKDSLSASVEQTSDGEPRAHIVGPDGAGYLVSEDPDHAGVRIASFSPCFVLPDGLWPGGEY